jgi:DTW domain-containing protein
LPLALCLCGEIPKIEINTELVILRHAKEAWKSTNSARLAALALSRCELLTYGAPGPRFELSPLVNDTTALLFPGPGPALPFLPTRLLILDGSWGQARRMLHRVPALVALPRLSFTAQAPTLTRLRRPPDTTSMSTLEAVARAVALLEGPEKAALLEDLYARFVDRVLQSRGRLPSGLPGGYAPSEE